MAFDIQPPKRKRPKPPVVEANVVVKKKKPVPAKSKPKPKPVKKKAVPKNKVETHSNASVQKTKKPKLRKQSSGAATRFFISFIGVIIVVGGVIFIRQNQAVNTPKKSDTKAGIVDKFQDELPTSVVPIIDDSVEEVDKPSGPDVELAEMHNSFVGKLNDLNNTEENILEVEPDSDGFISTFNSYLDEF